MKRAIVISLLVVLSRSLTAQDTVDRNLLLADFSYFINALEATHPDPYSGFGGRVFFQLEADKVKQDIKNNAYSKQAFAEAISTFISNLNDGHTILNDDAGSTSDKTLPFDFRVVYDGIILNALPAEYKDFLGSKVLAINDTKLSDVLKRITILYPCENNYGAYSWFIQYGYSSTFYRQLFPDSEKDSVSFLLKTPTGKEKQLALPFIDKNEFKQAKIERLPQRDLKLRNDYMAYQYLDEKEAIMYFKFSSIMARENFQYMLDKGFDNTEGQMRNFFSYTFKREMPTDPQTAINQMPSFSETFHDMLMEMKSKKSHTLIVDLRGNGGGWTPITLPSLYMMYGDRYLETEMGNKYYTRISPLFLKKTNTTLDAYNKNGATYSYGDITIPHDEPDELTAEERRNAFIVSSMCAIKDTLAQLNGMPVYTPDKVYVLTDTWTFSAAFHYAFYLWKMGATTVGIPSMQAPNTFMASTPFTLPNTGISGSISNSMQVFLPPNDRSSRIFYPDLILSEDEYKKYGFDPNAELLFLLDAAKKKK